MDMRIVTRPDFDGVVCAVLLKEALNIRSEIQWIQPNDIQNSSFAIHSRDVIANLPYDARCALWFDHHVSNALTIPYNGLFRIAPSAAGLIYEYYKNQLNSRFDELVRQTDKIDSGQLTLDEVLYPQRYPYVLLSMTTSLVTRPRIPFCNRLVEMLRQNTIDEILGDKEVADRCRDVITANKAYETHLRNHTRLQGGISITDFRNLDHPPEGNRFLVYSLFPETYANVKLFHQGSHISIKLGHSIFNSSCRVNVGKLLVKYGGGGHRGAGAGRLAPQQAAKQLAEIIEVLVANQPNED